jgi:hypothetical protein
MKLVAQIMSSDVADGMAINSELIVAFFSKQIEMTIGDRRMRGNYHCGGFKRVFNMQGSAIVQRPVYNGAAMLRVHWQISDAI